MIVGTFRSPCAKSRSAAKRQGVGDRALSDALCLGVSGQEVLGSLGRADLGNRSGRGGEHLEVFVFQGGGRQRYRLAVMPVAETVEDPGLGGPGGLGGPLTERRSGCGVGHCLQGNPRTV